MGVLRDISRLVEGLERLDETLRGITAALTEAGPAINRLEALELSRHQFEAECEGMLLRADGKRKAAENAEARTRTLKKSYEKAELDPFAPESEAAEASIVQGRHAAASEEDGLLPLHLDVAPTNSKTYALRAKYGL